MAAGRQLGRVASRERLETNSDISVLWRGLARGGAASLPGALTASGRGMCSALTAHPSLLTGSTASHPSNCRGITPPDGGLLRWSRRAAGIARGRLKGGPTVSTSVAALFYFLALVCFLGGAFAGLGRSSFANRVNLIALGLAFWVFVLFFNAFKRVIS